MCGKFIELNLFDQLKITAHNIYIPILTCLFALFLTDLISDNFKLISFGIIYLFAFLMLNYIFQNRSQKYFLTKLINIISKKNEW
jgi:hypothetical protein